MKQIPLTYGQFAQVDDSDFESASQFDWCLFRAGKLRYAARKYVDKAGVRRTEFLHQFLLGIKGVDHRDGDGLNDSRGNLRPATTQQNARARQRKADSATSIYRGVSWSSDRQKWAAKIGTGNHKTVHLGRFNDEVQAARAYDAAAVKFFGEFASPNFATI